MGACCDRTVLAAHAAEDHHLPTKAAALLILTMYSGARGPFRERVMLEHTDMRASARVAFSPDDAPCIIVCRKRSERRS